MNIYRQPYLIFTLFFSTNFLVSCHEFYLSRSYLVVPNDSKHALPTEQLIQIAVNIFESEHYECSSNYHELPELEKLGRMGIVEGYFCLHPHDNRLGLRLHTSNEKIVYELVRTFRVKPNERTEEQFFSEAEALRNRFEAAGFHVIQDGSVRRGLASRSSQIPTAFETTAPISGKAG